jgi:hypothetical protein
VQQLTATDWKLLHEISWLVACRRRDHPRADPYVAPSQEYLARKAGITREHVCRRLKVLHKLGFLKKQWRRPERGQYKTCLYWIADAGRWLIRRFLNTLASTVKSVMFTAPKRRNDTSLASLGSHLDAFQAAAPPKWRYDRPQAAGTGPRGGRDATLATPPALEAPQPRSAGVNRMGRASRAPE